MRNRHEPFLPVPYPTDKRGEPISPYELGYSSTWESPQPRNNHHLAFFAKRFGETAIGQAYRDLDVLQAPLVVDEHQFLHRTYTGLTIPHPDVMLDRINEEKEQQGKFKIYNFGARAYELFSITDEKIETLERTFRGKE